MWNQQHKKKWNNRKLKEINAYVRLTLDKLRGMRVDLERTDDNWQDWKFPQLVEALENWTCRNPKPLNHTPLSEDNGTNPYRNPNKVYQANQHQIERVYCKKSDHNPAGIYLLKVNNRNTRTRCEFCQS